MMKRDRWTGTRHLAEPAKGHLRKVLLLLGAFVAAATAVAEPAVFPEPADPTEWAEIPGDHRVIHEAPGWEALCAAAEPFMVTERGGFIWVRDDEGEPAFRVNRAYYIAPAGGTARWVLLDAAPKDERIGSGHGWWGPRAELRTVTEAPRHVPDGSFGHYAHRLTGAADQGRALYHLVYDAPGGPSRDVFGINAYVWQCDGAVSDRQSWLYLGLGPDSKRARMGHLTSRQANPKLVDTRFPRYWGGDPPEMLYFLQKHIHRRWLSSDERGRADPPSWHEDFECELVSYQGFTLCAPYPSVIRPVEERPYIVVVRGQSFESLGRLLATWSTGWRWAEEGPRSVSNADLIRSATALLRALNPVTGPGEIAPGAKLSLPRFHEIAAAAAESSTRPLSPAPAVQESEATSGIPRPNVVPPS